MRIIAGEFKGRRLKAPTWEGLRPTSDKLRETLFNIVANRVPGARVLDVFAGTGAIGLESLSRGATGAVFIESDRRASALIAATAERALQQPLPGDRFDLIVLDPPYDFELVAHVLGAAAAHLTPGGWIVLEHARRRAVADAVGLRAVRTVLSGDSALTFFEAP